MRYFIAAKRSELKDLINKLNTVYEASSAFVKDEESNKNIKFTISDDKPLEMTVDFDKK